MRTTIACIAATIATLGATAQGQWHDTGFHHTRGVHGGGFHDRGFYQPTVRGSLFVGQQGFSIFDGQITPQVVQALCAAGFNARQDGACIVVRLGRRQCAPNIGLNYPGFTLSKKLRHGRLTLRVEKVKPKSRPKFQGCGPKCGTVCVSTCRVGKRHTAGRFRATIGHKPKVTVQIGHGGGHHRPRAYQRGHRNHWHGTGWHDNRQYDRRWQKGHRRSSRCR